MNYRNRAAASEKFKIFDLRSRVCNILDLAITNLELVTKEPFIADDTSYNVRSEKIVGETALLLYVVSAWAGKEEEVRERIESLSGILIPHARSEKTLLEICLHPPLALEFAQAHILLSNIGYPDVKFDSLLKQTIHSQSYLCRERVPHRMLEQEWIKSIWDKSFYQANRFNQIVSYSPLQNPIDLLSCTRDDMYGFTHALMYVTNFNLSPNQLPRATSEILGEAEALLCGCLDNQDYDLAGELLLAWPILNTTWSAASAFAFRVLQRVEDEVGFLPSESIRLETLNKIEGNNRKKYFFSVSYHTAYVMGLLCSLAFNNVEGSFVGVETSDQVPARSKKIFHYLLNDSTPNPHWIQDYNKLTSLEQDELSGFLLNVALLRNVRKGRYNTVYELLCLGYEMNVTDTALASQIAELLERLALLSATSTKPIAIVE